MDSSTLTVWADSFPTEGVPGLFLLLQVNCFVEIPVFNANSVDPGSGSILFANPASILYKSTAGHYRPVSYSDGPITARYRFMLNAYLDVPIMGC